MKTKLIILLVSATLTLAFGASKATPASGLVIFVTNSSTTVSDAQIKDALPVFQNAVNQDFARYWGHEVKLYFAQDPPLGAWRIDVSDYDVFGCTCLGYHDLNGDSPIGFVFAQASADHGYSWTSTFTHELFEMLADPYLNRIALSSKLWLVEVADPVENESYDYTRISPSGQTILISDFVTPAWYRKKGKAPYDFENYVTRPFQILQGGYASYWFNGAWVSIFNRGKGVP